MSDTTPQQRSALKQALLAIDKLQSRIDALEQARTEPIAIIGMSCRFPGGATSPESFWRLLREGKDAISQVPPERWDVDALYDSDPGARGKVSTRWGGFLEGVDRFDAAFFGISPREAASMDPQQRLLLELAWEALEDGGLPPSGLMRSRTGVFIGLMGRDYLDLLRQGGLEQIDLYAGTGNTASAAAGRISYLLGLQGPSLAVDTACSSSLVAVHLACQSLRAGESELALVGAANLILTPDATVMLSRARAMAADGRCKAFDTSADGFVRSEGSAVVVLKRLSRALEDGDPIRAVIRGSAVNQDGRSSGLTVPNGLAQQELLRQALANARVAPSEVGYLEAHGTGTALGDPIEVEALGAVLGEGRPADRPLWLGSVKTNLGHMEAAAGLGSLLKVVLALEHGELPPHLHLRTPSQQLGLERIPARIPTEPTPWSGRRLAGVSSFSLSGTNAHLVVEAAPERPRVERAAGPGPFLLPLSARSSAALEAQVHALGQWLTEHPQASLADVGYTAALHRAHHPHRLALVASSHQELRELLSAAASGQERMGLARGVAGTHRVVFAFPGQGSQWPGMARGLLEREPDFLSALQQCDQAIARYSGFSVLERLRSGEELVGIDVIQPSLFAVQVALAAWWRAQGVVPDAVVGHSMGEVAAAHVAGALSLEDAARIICRRSRLMLRLKGQGAMAVVELPREQAELALHGLEDRLSVAVEASPTSTVLSGEPAALESVLAGLRAKDVFCRLVKVDVASHSPQMDVLREELLEALSGIAPRTGSVPLYSTVSSEVCSGSELDARYWVRNLRQPVLFSSAVARLLEEGHEVFIELSPHPLLLPSIEQVARHQGGARPVRAIATLRREESEPAMLRAALGALYCAGGNVRWQGQYPERGQYLRLPAYPWQRDRHWVEPARRRAPAARRGVHPLLGEHWAPAGRSELHLWQQELEPDTAPFLGEHLLQGAVVVPAAAYVEMALAAAAEALGPGPHTVGELRFEQMLSLREGEPRQVQVLVSRGEGGADFQVASRPAEGGEWTVHARAVLRPGARPLPQAPRALEPVRARCPEHMPAQAFYQAVGEQGVDYGPGLQGVQELWRGEQEAVARLAVPPGVEHGPYQVSPALVDGCLQVLLAALGGKEGGALPTAVARVVPGGQSLPERGLWAHARAEWKGAEATGQVELLNEAGEVLLTVEGVRLRRVGATGGVERMLLAAQWRLAPLPGSAPVGVGRCLVVAESAPTAQALGQLLGASGSPVVVALPGEELRRVEPGLYALAPEQPEQWRALLEQEPVEAVVHLGGVEGCERMGCTSVLALVQALAEHPRPPRLWLVTARAQPAGGPVEPQGAVLWGLAEAIRHEHPALRCTSVDVEEHSFPHGLLAELRSGSPEPRVALRRVERLVPRWVRWAPPPTSLVQPLRADATYLVTGGLTGMGLRVAEWLAEQGARHLVLMARREPSAQAREVMERLERSGVRVMPAQADVTRVEELRALLARVDEQMPPLRGIFHSAAVVADNLLIHLTAEDFRRVLAPKVQGAWHLHQATLGRELDHFVLFSSVVAQLGIPGSSNYGAANAFLDSLAWHRRAMGLPALSINWGIWSGVGRAATATMERLAARGAQRGLGSLAPEQGFQALELLLRQTHATQVAVTPFDARRWCESLPTAAQDPFFGELRPAAPPAARGEGVLAALRSAESAARRHALLEQHVREQVARVIHGSPEQLERTAPLSALGFDSLMALELRNRLEESLGLKLSATLVWTHPHLAALVDFLARQLEPSSGSAQPAPSAPSAQPAPALLQQLASLSDTEAEARLLEKLDNLKLGAA